MPPRAHVIIFQDSHHTLEDRIQKLTKNGHIIEGFATNVEEFETLIQSKAKAKDTNPVEIVLIDNRAPWRKGGTEFTVGTYIEQKAREVLGHGIITVADTSMPNPEYGDYKPSESEQLQMGKYITSLPRKEL